jgi:hypothetical protein
MLTTRRIWDFSMQICDMVCYAPPLLEFWCQTHDFPGGNHVFKYRAERQVPLEMACQHSDGTLSVWKALFTVQSSFSAVSRLDIAARGGGHQTPISLVLAHHVLPCMLSASLSASAAATGLSSVFDIVLWFLASPSRFVARLGVLLDPSLKAKLGIT